MIKVYRFEFGVKLNLLYYDLRYTITTGPTRVT